MRIKKNNTVAILNERGEIFSLKVDGKEYMWHADAKYWGWTSPTLFPFAGRVRDGKMKIGGVEYVQPTMHGFIRNLNHTVKEMGEDYCILTACSNEKTLERYPFPFVFETKYAVTDRGYEIGFTVKNTGDKPMPFCLGSHPAYLLPGELKNCDLIVEGTENAAYYATDEKGLYDCKVLLGRADGDKVPLDFDLFLKHGVLFHELGEKKAFSVIDRTTGRGFRIKCDQFPACVLWMPSEDCPFICVEPWHGLPDYPETDGNFEDKAFLITINPGEEHTLSYTFEAI